jgi:WbqC-like protein family
MKLGALQPGYLPWLGFFDQIAKCDTFILYDELPYAADSWRNRNRIRRPGGGWCWLTVPVVNKGMRQRAIKDIEISEQGNWRRTHWRTIQNHYARALFFAAYEDFFARLYEKRWRYLVDLDLEIIFYLLQALGIGTKIVIASAAALEADYLRSVAGRGDPTARVSFLCRRFGADCFLEGALGRTFMEPADLEPFGITLEYHDYQHPFYHQLFRGFIPYMSVIDLLFNHGPESLDILTARKTVSPP